jgi:hypothetical protein
MNKRPHLCIILLALIAQAGCGPTFAPHGRRMSPQSITSPLQWKISSEGDNFKMLRGAIDNISVTQAETRQADYRGASFVIDLGRPCIFNTVVLQHGSDEMGFAREVNIATSTDGKNYTDRYTAPGTRKVTFFNLLTPVSARYVRITATRAGKKPWTISQVYFQ